MDRVIKKRVITKKRVIIFILISALSLLFINKVVLQEYNPSLKINKSEIMLSVVKEEKISNTVQTIGLVEPVSRVSIESSERGKIVEIIQKSGTRISKGDAIIKLANENLINDYNQLKEELIKKEKNLILTRDEFLTREIDYEESLLELDYKLEKLKKSYNTNKVLFESKSIAKIALEDSEKEYNFWIKKRELLLEKHRRENKLQKSREDLVMLEISSIEKGIDYLRKRIDELTIKSPYSGILNIKNLSIGENIRAQEKVAQIDREDDFILTASIDEFYLNNISIGDRALFKLKAKDSEELEAELKFISPNVEENKVKLEFNFISKLPESVLPGQSFKIKIIQDAPKITKVIENGSFYKDSGGKWVYKLEKNQAVKVPIKIGTKNRDKLEIISGLEIGDRIIISNYKNFKNYNRLILEER